MIRYLPGGTTTQFFDDLDAEFIKIKDMGKGDFCRSDKPKINDISYYLSASVPNKKR